MKNRYEVRGDVTAIIVGTPKHGEMEALISTSKLDRVKEFPNTWSVMKDKNNTFYVYGRISKNNRQKMIMLHRWITDAPKGLEVDHINHNGLDNTDENMRVVTVAENQQNRKGATSRSSSGIRGVYWHKASRKWCAQIRVSNKKIDVGYFDDISTAAIALNEAKKKYTPMSYDIVS